jgi:hypothetical protein
MSAKPIWEPPSALSKDEIVKLHRFDGAGSPHLVLSNLPGLPLEIPVAKLWHDAIMNGFFLI